MIEYKIYPNVYEAMIKGIKNIEIRLLNDKSNAIKKDDKIKFQVVDSDKILIVKVTNKYIFNNLEELLNNNYIFKHSHINYTKTELKENLEEIFGKEKIENFKIVGIEFEIEE